MHSQVADALKSAGASLWVVVLQIGGQPMNTSEARERAAVIGDVTTDSGGMSKVVLSAPGPRVGVRHGGGAHHLAVSRDLRPAGRARAAGPHRGFDASS